MLLDPGTICYILFIIFITQGFRIKRICLINLPILNLLSKDLGIIAITLDMPFSRFSKFSQYFLFF